MVTAQEDRKETLLGMVGAGVARSCHFTVDPEVGPLLSSDTFIKNSSGLIDDIHLLNMYRETCKIMGIKHAPSSQK